MIFSVKIDGSFQDSDGVKENSKKRYVKFYAINFIPCTCFIALCSCDTCQFEDYVRTAFGCARRVDRHDVLFAFGSIQVAFIT